MPWLAKHGILGQIKRDGGIVASYKKGFFLKTRQPRIGWCVASLSSDIASVRYRAILPLLALEAERCSCQLFTSASTVSFDEMDALVIVKSFTVESYHLAQEASAKGVAVIIDLCDNIFIEAYGNKNKAKASDMFMAMINHVSAIVATTEPLAAVIREQVGYAIPVHVIPDGVESAASVASCTQRLAQTSDHGQGSIAPAISRQARKIAQRLSNLRTSSFKGLLKVQIKRSKAWLSWRFWAKRAYKYFDHLRSVITQRPRRLPLPATSLSPRTVGNFPTAKAGTLRILWFGNHGAPHARFGMLDLLDIREALEQIALEFPVELVVVSNNRDKYEKHIKPLAIPSCYLDWSSDVVEQCLADARVVIVPNSRDAFSLCKSANRTVHALTRGVPVVATATPALEPLAGSIVVDDFLQGLRRYLSNSQQAKADVARGLKLIEQHFNPAVIAAAWRQVLDAAMIAQVTKNKAAEAQLIIVLHLIQDLDLAMPIVLAAKARGIPLQVWSSISLLKKSPRVVASLQVHGVSLVAIPDGPGAEAPSFSAQMKVLLTIAETNLGPHRFPRTLTEQAQRAGLFTATLQHGLENVGLTYSDEIHAIEKINFAAERIYIWGANETLHANVSPATRAKCKTVGCPKPPTEPAAGLSDLIPDQATVIGIFENLHWHRYSDEYRQFFLDGVTALALKFPSITFLVKPHHAGLWLTSRFKGDKPIAANLVIADPRDPAWEAYTAGSLLGRMKAVITTPSTVALDGARHGLPVAIVAHQLDLDNYAPLYRIREPEGWINFVTATLEASALSEQITSSALYVDRMTLAGDAVERILDDIFN